MALPAAGVEIGAFGTPQNINWSRRDSRIYLKRSAVTNVIISLVTAKIWHSIVGAFLLEFLQVTISIANTDFQKSTTLE